MVVKIQQSSGSMAGVIDYNERKVDEGEACVVDIHGIQAPDRSSIEAEFQRLEKRNIRTQNVSFHLSINPGPDDNMNEQEIIEFAGKIMKGLGYENQPYVIYRHEDIERTHYHVVSIRVNENGRKIRDRQEQNRCQRIMRKMQEEYSFRIGNEEPKRNDSAQQAQSGNLESGRRQNHPVVPIFQQGEGDVIAKMTAAFDRAVGYNFTTWPQFKWIMEAHGVKVDIVGTEDEKRFTLQGLDQNGNPCSSILTEKEMGRPLHEQFLKRIQECSKEDMKNERNRAGNAVKVCVKNANGEEQLKERLAEKGFSLHLSRGKDGILFGTTIIDHKKRCAFKGSELGRDISAMIKACVGTKGQEQGQQAGQISPERQGQNNSPSKALLYALELFLAHEQQRRGSGKDKKKKKRRRRL